MKAVMRGEGEVGGTKTFASWKRIIQGLINSGELIVHKDEVIGQVEFDSNGVVFRIDKL